MRADEAMTLNLTEIHDRDLQGCALLGGHHMLHVAYRGLPHRMGDAVSVSPNCGSHYFRGVQLYLGPLLEQAFPLLRPHSLF